MKHQEITEKIIGCAYRVYNKLGYGFLESVYEKALMIELRKSGLRAERQKAITVYYDGEDVGNFSADVFVESEIIVELKSVTALCRAHEVQLVNYLKATEKYVGLLINFGETKVVARRKVRDFSDLQTHNPVNPSSSR